MATDARQVATTQAMLDDFYRGIRVDFSHSVWLDYVEEHNLPVDRSHVNGIEVTLSEWTKLGPRIVYEQPVPFVTFTDRSPQETLGCLFCWLVCLSDRVEHQRHGRSRFHLPMSWWPFQKSVFVARYRHKERAKKSASMRAIRWARRVGRPPAYEKRITINGKYAYDTDLPVKVGDKVVLPAHNLSDEWVGRVTALTSDYQGECKRVLEIVESLIDQH